MSFLLARHVQPLLRAQRTFRCRGPRVLPRRRQAGVAVGARRQRQTARQRGAPIFATGLVRTRRRGGGSASARRLFCPMPRPARPIVRSSSRAAFSPCATRYPALLPGEGRRQGRGRRRLMLEEYVAGSPTSSGNLSLPPQVACETCHATWPLGVTRRPMTSCQRS